MKKIINFILCMTLLSVSLHGQTFPSLKFEGGNNEPAWNSNFIQLLAPNCMIDQRYWIGPNMNSFCNNFPNADGEANFITVNAGPLNGQTPMFRLNIPGWQVTSGSYFLSMDTRHRYNNNIDNTLDVFVGNTYITTINMPRNNTVWSQLEVAINVPQGVQGTLSILQVQNGNYQSNDYSIDNIRLCSCALPRAIFTFQDANQAQRNNFCPGEQIFLNGIPSINEQGYQIFVQSRLIADGPWAPFTNGVVLMNGNSEWFSGQVGLINLTAAFANNNPPLTFVQGFEYKVRVAVANECSDWEPTARTFTVNCCNPPSTFGCFTDFLGRRGLLWNPVPGATEYQLQIIINDPACCPGAAPINFPVITTTNTSIILDPDIAIGCFSWRVTTICANGTHGMPSARQCYMPNQFCGPQRLASDGSVLITNIKLFPNPVIDGNLKISIQGEDENSSTNFLIISIDGRIQQTYTIVGSKEESIDVSQLSAGMYIVKAIQNGQQIYTSKFQKL